MYCKLIARDPLQPHLGATWTDENPAKLTTLESHILEDKKYGMLESQDGKLKYILLNHDEELTKGEAVKAINAAMMEWQTSLGVDFERTSIINDAIIKIQFKSSEEDQIFKLEPNVLAYMYYPIGGMKGIMVINSDYAWTPNGEAKSGRWIQEHTGRTVQWLDNMYETWSLFKVTRHELGHGLGLPHTLLEGHTMSSNYSKMSNHNTSLDEGRGQAKYGKPKRSLNFIKIMIKWVRRRFG